MNLPRNQLDNPSEERINIPLTAGSCAGHFSRSRAPIARVQSGDRLRLRTPEANWFLHEQPRPLRESDLVMWEARQPEDLGHCMIGPIEVAGAEPGMTLEVELEDVVPASWGWSGAEQNEKSWGRKLGLNEGSFLSQLWEIDVDAGLARNQFGDEVRIRPFPGLIGMPPNLPGRHSTIPPRNFGGNLDCRELVAGSRLFLPVSVPGALLSLGDGHAAQGDGEVSGVAIECPLERVDLRITLHEHATIPAPRAITPAGRVAFGFHASLDEAWARALDNMLLWMMDLYSISRIRAVALASIAVDLRVTQVVNQVAGVHALLREDDLSIGHIQAAPG